MAPLLNHTIATRLKEVLEGRTFRDIATDTGFHHESVRRYLRGDSKVPAEFIASICAAYGIDPALLLLQNGSAGASAARNMPPTDHLVNNAVESLRPAIRAWIASIRPVGVENHQGLPAGPRRTRTRRNPRPGDGKPKSRS